MDIEKEKLKSKCLELEALLKIRDKALKDIQEILNSCLKALNEGSTHFSRKSLHDIMKSVAEYLDGAVSYINETLQRKGE